MHDIPHDDEDGYTDCESEWGERATRFEFLLFSINLMKLQHLSEFKWLLLKYYLVRKSATSVDSCSVDKF